MKCSKCNYDNREGVKFCEGCGNRMPSICPECGSEVGPQARFCGSCGARLSGEISVSPGIPVPRLEDMHNQLQSLIPEVLAQKYLTAEQQAAEGNRPITALFADISGFSTLSQNHSSEAIYQLVQECFRHLVNIVAGYEGSISGFRGDGLLALFGAPILHENDAERAVLAAMDMHKTMHDRGLEVSIGVNSAMMTVAEVQTMLHREYTVYGTAVNLAKRLQEAAQPGQILAGAGTYRLTRWIFDFQILPGLEVKGFPDPVTGYTVQGLKTHPEKLRGIEGLRSRMVGREKEFQELTDIAEEWLAGRGQIVSIIGEAGIGKSRLASELKSYIQRKSGDPDTDKGALWFEGRCVSIGQPISYWPFLDILRSWFGLKEEDSQAELACKVREHVEALLPGRSDDTLPFLGHLMNLKFGNELDTMLEGYSTEQVKYQTMMRLRSLFVAMAQQKPLMLILEDLHWADDLSLDLISLLMDELMDRPLMLVCVYRPEREHRVWRLSDQAQRKCLERYIRIWLEKLSMSESRRLVQELLTIDNLPDRIRDSILGKSEGNPFFIEEVIRSLIERGLVYREDDHWKAREKIVELDVPDTIQSIILARIDRLEAEAKYVLQCASVIGRLFKHRLLDHLTRKQQELEQYIHELEERDLIYEERTVPELEYAFKHALTQEATYQGILEQRRRAFHREVAIGIERLYQERIEDFYEELAHHWERSGDKEKTLEYLLKAGNKAAKRYLNKAAIDYYTQALKLSQDMDISGDELAEIYEYRGSLYGSMTFYEESVSDMKQAGAIYTDRTKKARMYSEISRTFQFQIVDVKEAVEYAHKAIEAIDPEDRSRDAALIYEAAGSVFVYSINMTEGEKLLRKAVSISEDMGYTDLLALHYTLIKWMYWFFPRTQEFMEQNLLAKEKAFLYLPYSKSNLYRYSIACGLLSGASSGVRSEDGKVLALEALEAGLNSGNGWIVVVVTSYLGFAYRSLGDMDKAIEVCEKGWGAGVRVRYIAWGYMTNFAKELIRLYSLRNEERKLLDMMFLMVDSTLILHGKPEVHPTVQFHWNNTVEDMYRCLRTVNLDAFRALKESMIYRLREIDSEREQFFYHGQLALLSLLDNRPADALGHLGEMGRLYPVAGEFAHRLPKDLESAVEIMNAPSESKQMMAKNFLGSQEKLDDLSRVLDGINLVLTEDEFAQAVDWDKVDRFALKQIQSGDFITAPWAENSFKDSWLKVLWIYQKYKLSDRLRAMAERIHETMAEILKKQGVSQLLPEPVESMGKMRIELSEDFEQDPASLGWDWVDPMNDCSYRIEAGKYLEIEVPPDHDMWYRTNCDAPRFMRHISGDFILETRISHGSGGRKAGGLLIWKDKDNLISLEVSASSLSYIAYIDQSRIYSCLYPLEADSCGLRLERRGERFTVYADWGIGDWQRCGWIDMPLEDPAQIGIYSLCPAAPTTSTRFEYFRIYRPE